MALPGSRVQLALADLLGKQRLFEVSLPDCKRAPGLQELVQTDAFKYQVYVAMPFGLPYNVEADNGRNRYLQMGRSFGTHVF